MNLFAIRAIMFNRRAKQQAEEVIEHLSIRSGDNIADLGSGGGYFLFKFAQEVAPGKVYAVDTNKGLLRYIRQQRDLKQNTTIETIVADPEDPHLPRHSVDLIFVRNVFHHINNPEHYFKRLKSCLKPGGRIAIIEWRPHAAHGGHGTSEQRVLGCMLTAGYTCTDSFTFLKAQSFNIFTEATL